MKSSLILLSFITLCLSANAQRIDSVTFEFRDIPLAGFERYPPFYSFGDTIKSWTDTYYIDSIKNTNNEIVCYHTKVLSQGGLIDGLVFELDSVNNTLTVRSTKGFSESYIKDYDYESFAISLIRFEYSNGIYHALSKSQDLVVDSFWYHRKRANESRTGDDLFYRFDSTRLLPSSEFVVKIFGADLPMSSVHGSSPSLPRLSFYPNPATDWIIFFVSEHFSRLPVTIYNGVGQKVVTTQSISNHGKIDISKLPSGLFYVQAGSEAKKLIIE